MVNSPARLTLFLRAKSEFSSSWTDRIQELRNQIVVNELYYSDGVRWLMLPAWGRFFVHLGLALSAEFEAQRKVVAALAVPTRSYAAALTAFGIIVSRSSSPVKQISSADHFKQLLEVKEGTPVTVLNEGIRQKGITEGPYKIGNRIWLRIKLRGGELAAWKLVQESDALNVEIVENEDEKVPKRITGRLITPISSFARNVVTAESVTTFVTMSRLDCLLIGRLNKLRPEIVEAKFATRGERNGEFSEGRLQDVIRVRSLLDPSEPFRSDILSSAGHGPSKVTQTAPTVVVFDGSASFLRSRGWFETANWVILLDRTDSAFGDAMMLCNQEYTKRRVNDVNLEGIHPVPIGVDLISYYESRR